MAFAKACYPKILTKTLDFEFAKAQSALLKLRGDAKYAAGNDFTMADILLTHTISWAELFKFKVEKDLLEYKTRIEIQRKEILTKF